VGVAAEVGEDVLGAREGGLAADDPGLLAQLAEPRGQGCQLREGGQAAGDVQVVPVEGALQAGEIPAAEDLREGTDREEEAGPSRNPARPAGHDAVHVHMLREGFSPRVEHGGHAHGATEMARIATEALQRGGRALERAGDRAAAR
jgi:hypothetical protein